jgi:hypothetical protein
MDDVATPPAAPAAPATPVPAGGDGKTTPEPVKSTGQTFTINGKAWSENDLAQRIQKAEGLEKRVADADRYEKAFNNFAAQVDDPAKFIALLDSKEFKYDEDKQAALMKSMLETKKPKLVQAVKQWLYENEVEPSTLTEEQRKLRELEKENQRFKTAAQKAEELRKTEEQNAEAQKIWNDYRIKIGQGIKAEMLPETEMMVARIARKAMLMRRAGQPADIPSAVKAVKTELNAEYLMNLDKASAEEIVNLLPESVLKKVNAAYVNKLKKAQTPEPDKKEPAHPFKRKTKQEVTSKENKDFWRNAGRGVFAS